MRCALRETWRLLDWDCFQVPEAILAVLPLFCFFHEPTFVIALKVQPATLPYHLYFYTSGYLSHDTFAYPATFFLFFPPFPLSFSPSSLSFLKKKKVSLAPSHLYSNFILLLWLWLASSILWLVACCAFWQLAQIKELSNALLFDFFFLPSFLILSSFCHFFFPPFYPLSLSHIKTDQWFLPQGWASTSRYKEQNSKWLAFKCKKRIF